MERIKRTIKICTILSIILLGLTAHSASAATPTMSKKEVLALLDEKLAGNRNKKAIIATIECESGFQNIQSRVPSKGGPNGREDSWGIVQIHLPSWRGIVTKQQALDQEFAIDFITKHFALGHQRYWTCWRNLSRAGVIPSKVYT